MGKYPSPCIDVCKYRRQGHCIACSMTKEQKSLFKTLRKKKHQGAFLTLLLRQQADMGKFRAWPEAYAKKCRKRDVVPPSLAEG